MIQYAERFRCHPQDVAGLVKVRWWYRLNEFDQAHAARQAYERSQQVEDWVRDLSASERAAMQWAMEEENERSD